MALGACQVSVVIAQFARPVVAESLQILVPVGSIEGVDALGLELHDRVVGSILGPVWNVGDEAWGHMHDLMKVLGVET